MQTTWQEIPITETVQGYHKRLENGLNVYLVPNTEYQEAHAAFITNYGSTMRRFVHPETGEWYQAPDGVAHFLEHKKFDQPDDTDVFLRFTGLGASANAYTTQKQTVYTFVTNQNVAECTAFLLDYVQTPYFTEESVEKEKGIIAQEIKMYDDNYDWVGNRLSLAYAYPSHPVGVDIAGTVESIYAITKEDLYTCYNTFYHPSNMTLVLSGNFDLAELQTVIEENQAAKDYDEQQPITLEKVFDETLNRTKAVRKDIDAKTNYITAVYKDICTKNDEKPKQYQGMIVEILLDMLFSEISEYADMFYDEELIDSDMGYYCNYQDDYAYIMTQVTTKKPSAFIDAYRSCWYEGSSVTPEQFQKIRKSILGSLIQIQNSPGVITRFLTEDIQDGITPKVLHEWLHEITFEEIYNKYEEIKARLDDYLTFVLLQAKSTNAEENE